MKPKIYIFNNGGKPGWYHASALAEDGHFLASHICSDPGFIPHDMGITSNWKHEYYTKHYPNGWELELVTGNIKEHKGLMAAYDRHLKLGDEPEENTKIKVQNHGVTWPPKGMVSGS